MMVTEAPQTAPVIPTHTRRPFTGRHMTIILVCFFAVVVGVNVLMARFAVGTFGGTVVDNSYVASQNFNDWLAEARAQKALGWTVAITRDPGGRPLVTVRDASGANLGNAVVTAVARHPLGRRPDQSLRFDRTADGGHLSASALGAGRWQLVVTIAADGHHVRVAETLS